MEVINAWDGIEHICIHRGLPTGSPFLYWGAFLKSIRMKGTKEEQGKLFGAFEGFSGILIALFFNPERDLVVKDEKGAADKFSIQMIAKAQRIRYNSYRNNTCTRRSG